MTEDVATMLGEINGVVDALLRRRFDLRHPLIHPFGEQGVVRAFRDGYMRKYEKVVIERLERKICEKKGLERE